MTPELEKQFKKKYSYIEFAPLFEEQLNFVAEKAREEGKEKYKNYLISNGLGEFIKNAESAPLHPYS